MSCGYTPNNSLRLKIESACNMRCTFCHSEGNRNTDRMTTRQVCEILDFASRYGYPRIHLTGGEPMLHPDIDEIVQACTLREMTCTITSNGQCNPTTIERLMATGLQSINFSLPTIRPDIWSKLQGGISSDISTRQINRVLGSIEFCVERGLRTKVNIVVSDGAAEVIEVINYLEEVPVEIRLLDVLGNRNAPRSIGDVLVYYDARLIDEIVIMGSSRVNRIYDSMVGRLVIKAMRPYRIASVCNNCRLECYEGIYGIRFEAQGGIIYARFCVQCQDDNAIRRLNHLSTSPQFQEIYGESGVLIVDSGRR